MTSALVHVSMIIIWHTTPILTGWVYFVSEHYITIEIGVKCKDDENIADCPIHKKTHCLVLCFPDKWEELEYVKNRRWNDHIRHFIF